MISVRTTSTQVSDGDLKVQRKRGVARAVVDEIARIALKYVPVWVQIAVFVCAAVAGKTLVQSGEAFWGASCTFAALVAVSVSPIMSYALDAWGKWLERVKKLADEDVQ